MAQVLKDAIHAAIHAAALEVFAREGWRGATVAAIARAAGISVGNVYRYFPGKEALFEAAVPGALAQALAEQVEGYALALLDDDAASDEALLALCAAHRHALIILLGYDDGTPRAGFAAALVEALVARTLTRCPARRLNDAERFALARAYDHLLFVLVEALTHHPSAEAAAPSIRACARYHAAGVRALLGAAP